MKKFVIGILAHVDAGKTTLSEALLYRSGVLRKLGRVDHQDAFLDTDAMERERGITIFSKQAVLPLGEELEATLLDTPGHVDFSAEMERTLQVLDCAILVVSGTDGVQAHTRTVWQLLERYNVPTFLFVNKMDLAGADQTALLEHLKRQLDSRCVNFGGERSELLEEAAVCDERALEQYLETGEIADSLLTELIADRKLFPCWFGTALKLQGVDELLHGLAQYAPIPKWGAAFGARAFKIARDAQGVRLTYLKVTGGTLRVKTMLSSRRSELEEADWEEKIDQIRIYSGTKYQTVEEAPAGTVCAVTGLSRTVPGEGFGFDTDWTTPVLEPVLTYQVCLLNDVDPHTALQVLRQLEEEDPALHVVWKERLREIHVQLMGEVQLEILQRMLQERFGLTVTFGAGSIVYKETITTPVEGIGHFEPLRHYAEVHLLLEPGEPGSGLVLDTVCSEDALDRNWQRLILTHLAETAHPGVLTGSPITDMKITLVAGRAHVKHTEGGDFRQATYRAVRQGLMQAESVLLEPWYSVRLEVPSDQVGRAMSDLQRKGGQTNPPEPYGEGTVLTGTVPVASFGDYAREFASYTRGRGRLSCTLLGYRPCAEQDSVVAAIGYDPERDVDHPADSVFCSHGAGIIVPWTEVAEMAHVRSGLCLQEEDAEPEPAVPQPRQTSSYAGTLEQDKELQAIFERTYGAVKRQTFQEPRPPKRPTAETMERRQIRTVPTGPEYLLVDGYNIIYAWEELSAIARENLDAARKQLCDLLSNYQGFRNCRVIVVFDAYKVKGGQGSVEQYHNIHVVYTKEAETADSYIERATYQLGRENRVRVATSDGPEQLIILGHGALRVSASAFREEVEHAEGCISSILSQNNRPQKQGSVRAAMERAQQKNRGERR